jgi:hypothetical protein
MPESSDSGMWLLAGLLGGVIVGTIFTYIIMQSRTASQLSQMHTVREQMPPPKTLTPNMGNGIAYMSRSQSESGQPIINIYTYPFTDSWPNQQFPPPKIPEITFPKPEVVAEEHRQQMQPPLIENPTSTYKNREEIAYEYDDTGKITKKIITRNAEAR